MADKITNSITYAEYLEIERKRVENRIKLLSTVKTTQQSQNPSVDFEVVTSVDPNGDPTDPKSLKIDIKGYPTKSVMGNLLDGDAWVPIPPGATVSVPSGAKIYLPKGTKTVLTSNGVDTLIEGRGLLSPIEVAGGGSFTAPEVSPTEVGLTEPIDGAGSYPVILTIDRIVLIEDGINYRQGDRVVITPSNGASAVANITAFGRVDSITVTNEGVAFNEIPEITIESETGYGAVLRPIFKINRLKDLTEEELLEIEKKIPQDKIINVVDCVGKII